MKWSDRLGRLASRESKEASISEKGMEERSARLDSLRAAMTKIAGPTRNMVERRTVDPRFLDLPFVWEEETETLFRSVLRKTTLGHLLGAVSPDSFSSLGQLEWGIPSDKVLFIDTETTGLAGGTGTLPFLIGYAWFEGEETRFEQVLVTDFGRERGPLERFHRCWENAGGIVSFNGKSFDVPLLRTRMTMNRLPALSEKPHLDLLHLVRRVHRTRLRRHKLKDIEAEILRFDRGEDIDGSEISGVYHHFIRSGETDAMKQVVHHNEIDVLSLAALYALYGTVSKEESAFLLEEPLLSAEDYLDIAKTLQRNADHEGSLVFVERAMAAQECSHGAPPATESGQVRETAALLRARANQKLSRIREAIADYESVEGDKRGVAALELSKLYEHKVRQFDEALRFAEAAEEPPEKKEKRLRRIEQKRARNEQLSLLKEGTKRSKRMV